MKTFIALALTLFVAACASPASVDIRPRELVLEGKGATGKLEAHIFADNGKELDIKDFPVTWMSLDEKVAKVMQDGTVKAISSGKALVDVEIVGTETPGIPGTAIRGAGEVVVKIPGWVEVSNEEVHLQEGQPTVTIWAEVRSDTNHALEGYVPTWKIDNDSFIETVTFQNDIATRAVLKITPKGTGETFLTAVYNDLATDVVLTVSPPPSDAPAE